MSVKDNLEQVNENIASACARVNRNIEEITLVAVSKKKSVESILEAIEAGQKHFGENRVEESEQKIPIINDRVSQLIHWHMIGHIQSRKAKNIFPLFSVVHSLDSLKLAERLSRLAVEMDKTIDVLMECNVSGEEAKYGFNGYNWNHDSETRDNLWKDFEYLLQLPKLRIKGLMTMAPFVDDMELIRPVFASLFNLREELSQSFQIDLPDLSMGMTNDYEVAIEEGATIIRVGRAIFGERIY